MQHASDAEVGSVPQTAAAAGSWLLPAFHPTALATALAAGNLGHVFAAVRAATSSNQVSHLI
jgi:predicted metal-dependent hydrolase